jgi:hypothetical protein
MHVMPTTANPAEPATCDLTPPFWDRLAFCGACLYILAQAYMVPLAAAGPSWAVWPTLADAASIVVGMSLLLGRRRIASDPWARVLMAGAAGCALSFFLVTYLDIFGSTARQLGKGLSVGSYELYRVVQFCVIFLALLRIQLSFQRVRIVFAVALATFLLITVGVAATYFGVVSTSSLVSNLPQSKAASGAWFGYIHPDEYGLGMISYNHGYTGLQIMMAAFLVLHLAERCKWQPIRPFVLLLALGAIFLCGSRSALVAFGVFALCECTKASVAVLFSGAALSFALIVGHAAGLAKFDAFADAIQREKTITTSYDEDGLAGRTSIWADRWAFASDRPARVVVGSGFGSAMETGSNGHMLLLHVFTETGAAGLAYFLAAALALAGALKTLPGGGGPLLRGSLALALTCMTQETFYPVPAFGHFLGFYLASISLATRFENAGEDAAR